ncbi:MAG TPA: response regulator [Thermoguttaceae bacterium]|nr:response regulator [Thermoguttaceae bacterium]
MSPKKILIADDDRDLVRVLQMRCRQLGVDVITAHDAMTALTLIHEQRPDLVCLDISMPAGSGLSVCEMLSSDENLSSTAVIMLTGSNDEETIRRCHELCAYYVLKSSDVWQRMEPIVCELLEIQPAACGAIGAENAQEPQEPRYFRRGLSGLCDVISR